jgi:hypothetical protein
VFIIIDCPNASYIASLIYSPKFDPHYSDVTDNPVAVMVHMCGEGVLEHQGYREWMRKFGEKTKVTFP